MEHMTIKVNIMVEEFILLICLYFILGHARRWGLFFFKLIYFWLHCVFVAAHGLSLVAVSGGYSWL